MRSYLFRGAAVPIVAAVAILALLVFAGNQADPAGAQVGGPVIIGGDDLTDHGSVDDTTVPPTLFEGWLYIRKALENIVPNVTRADDGTVAVLGSTESQELGDDAGAAYFWAVPQVAGLSGVNFHEGEEEIAQFFADLAAGTAKPAIIVISGTGAGNDLSDDDDGDAFSDDEGAALASNALAIGNFVNSGGGLMSHGTEYGWLFALLPGASTVDSGSSGDLYLTPEGTTAFPGLTNNDINAGPWHNHFEGDLGGLQVLVRSTDVDDSQLQDAAVIIGGAQVRLPGSINLDPATDTNPAGTSHTVTATVRQGAPPAPAAGVTVTFSIISGPNSGATGTCSANANCTTDANGQVSFTYTSNGSGGTDTIQASFVDETQTTQSTTAQKTWEAPPATPTPTPTPQPTVAAAQLPATGGTPGAGAGFPWLAVVAAAFIAGSGGLALAFQRRRAR